MTTRIPRVGMTMIAAAAALLSVARGRSLAITWCCSAPLPVRGWAEPGEQVRVSLADATAETRSGEDGRWRCLFPRRLREGPSR